MEHLNILIHPDPRLKRVSKTVSHISEGVKKLSEKMLDTMYSASGVGLAAPQVGVLERLIVIDCADIKDQSPIVLVNPEITWSSEESSVFEEGCLSIPEIREEISRPKSVRVKFLSLENVEKEQLFEGLWATCVQHEIDHLNGKLFIDYLGPIKRSLITRKMRKYQREIDRS